MWFNRRASRANRTTTTTTTKHEREKERQRTLLFFLPYGILYSLCVVLCMTTCDKRPFFAYIYMHTIVQCISIQHILVFASNMLLLIRHILHSQSRYCVLAQYQCGSICNEHLHKKRISIIMRANWNAAEMIDIACKTTRDRGCCL